MKTENIYVGIGGATLALKNGKAVAVFPPRKGEDVSYMLLESDEMVRVKGARINGVGVPRYLKENGFELAPRGDSRAERLADLVDVRDGTALVEAASRTKAAELQEAFAGQDCTFVPFDETRPSVVVSVEESKGIASLNCDLLAGLSLGGVRIGYVPGSGLASTLALSSGWLVGPTGDPGSMPRNTGYGGIVERAVYTLCNCGLGTLIGERNLKAVDTPVDVPYPRGLLGFAVTDTDVVQVGVTGNDEVEVVYRRAGEVLYTRPRSPLASVLLAHVIGAIAAVMVHVRELDARPVKKARTKAA